MTERPIPPLPEPLARGAEQLRAMDAPEGFEGRLRAALAQVDRPGAARPHRRWTGWLVLVPSLAAMAVALHVVVSPRAREDIGRFEERSIELAPGEPTFVELDLSMHHHRDDPALVHVDAPSNVSLHIGEPSRDLTPSSCDEDRCVHRYVHPDESQSSLRVRIDEPGRYHIHVEHSSQARRVREHFVVDAH